MTKEDILRLRDTAEQTRVQFKERVTRDNKNDRDSNRINDRDDRVNSRRNCFILH